MAHLTPEAAAIVLLKQARDLKLDVPVRLQSVAEAEGLYRRAAILVHPDKRGGNSEAMKALNEAIRVLREAVDTMWPLPPAKAPRQAASPASPPFETSHRKVTPKHRTGTVVEIRVQPPPAGDAEETEAGIVGTRHERREAPGISKVQVVYGHAKPGKPPRIISNLSPNDPLLAGDPFWSPFAEDAGEEVGLLEFTNVPRPTPRRARTRYHNGNEGDSLLSEKAKEELSNVQQAPPPEPPGEAGASQP